MNKKQLYPYLIMNISVNFILILNLFRPMDIWWYLALIALLLNLPGTFVILRRYKKASKESNFPK
ncbi:hypothetical protein [Alteribacillus bidgolensis]|uniref:Uncharacterized protein n=1 Tax=Alteribacillus bidgolensis TaxID=930129 RepID=A0A1G8H9F1_9BACI|nr:hypothetical protein [Alteribacillus bidgolensis]SDI03255.1 hypothetical protein SAMN05216352_104164 [Alteribacillus bidgolensis]